MADETVFSFRYRDETPDKGKSAGAAAHETPSGGIGDTKVIAREIASELASVIKPAVQEKVDAVKPPPLPKYVTPKVVDQKRELLDALKATPLGKPIVAAERFATAANRAGQAAGVESAAFGRIAMACGVAAAAITALGVVTTKAVAQFNKSAQELQQFSGRLATAFAANEVANIRQQISRANFSGAQLSRFIEAQGKLERIATRIITILERAGLELILPALEPMATIADRLEKYFQTSQGEKIANALSTGVANGISLAVNPYSAGISAMFRYFRSENAKADEPREQLPLDEFLSLAAQLRGGTY